MSRQLSERQKEILVLCFERRFLTFQEILVELWGKKVTQAHYASISRSLTRLWRAGALIIWKSVTGLTGPGTGVSLTNKGKMLAVSIMAEGERQRISVKPGVNSQK
jgi:hypothetical protein